MTIQPTVYVVEDDRAVRDSLVWLLQNQGIRVQSFADPEEILAAFQRNWVGCLVLDLALPVVNGLDLYRSLKDRGCTLPFIVITGHGEIPDATRAIRLGAIDFLEKPFDTEWFLKLIGQALDLSIRQRDASFERQKMEILLESLTARESEIMELMVQGLMTKQIARKLEISIKTVEAHRSNILKKLDVESVVQLVRKVTLHRLAPQPTGADLP